MATPSTTMDVDQSIGTATETAPDPQKPPPRGAGTAGASAADGVVGDVSAALFALEHGDATALEATVGVLVAGDPSSDERKALILGLVRFLSVGESSQWSERVAAAGRAGLVEALIAQLRLLRGPADDEERMAKKARFIFNATLSVLANLAFGGLTGLILRTGGFDLMIESLTSSHERTLKYACAGLMNMTHADSDAIRYFQNIPGAIELLAGVMSTEGHEEDTFLHATGAMQNVSRTLSGRRGLFEVLEDLGEGPQASSVATKLAEAKQRRQAIREGRAVPVIQRYARGRIDRRRVRELREERALQFGAVWRVAMAEPAPTPRICAAQAAPTLHRAAHCLGPRGRHCGRRGHPRYG